MPKSSPIRVLLIEDHEVLRGGLVFVLETFDDLELVGEASGAEEGIKLCGSVHPDVVLMDLVMPVMDGITATHIIREKYPHIRVIALTSFSDQGLFEAAKEAGVSNYLVKDISIDQLAAAIRNAYAGTTNLSFPL